MQEPDELISDHPYEGSNYGPCTYLYSYGGDREGCEELPNRHANPGPVRESHLLTTEPHPYQNNNPNDDGHCTYSQYLETAGGLSGKVCGYPRSEHGHATGTSSGLVRLADVAQYARAPLTEEAKRGITVALIDAPTDPLGTLAVLCGIYEGRVLRSKAEATDEQRREAYDAMMATALSGPLEAIQFTFLVEGVDRALTHQAVRNRFSFFAQESLRFAVPEQWANDLPLPPSLAGLPTDDPAVRTYRGAMQDAEFSYEALVARGVPAEEARGVLPHAITTRYYWTVSLRTLLQEAGKRTCTQAQFPWRVLFGGVAASFWNRSKEAKPGQDYGYSTDTTDYGRFDGWQYKLFAEAIRPVCYQEGGCKFMAKFDRGCTIRGRVDAFERLGVPSSTWHSEGAWAEGAINPAEWAADPAAARVTEKG